MPTYQNSHVVGQKNSIKKVDQALRKLYSMCGYVWDVWISTIQTGIMYISYG